ncbi:putative mitochondrial 2-oxoglutarate/malate carrier protein [Phytophthora cinnamomi]|uniref:putative mitochondrial 2-oxoglutarate/malate carrier protein n=1 Tax=Phytophthora cinnamomi TaxID=4785 RepID=UPI00355A47EC|nr:putative mitochondrial 2-oxoglutarate/malate carrier protein [Phytophthora cinnamomi]
MSSATVKLQLQNPSVSAPASALKPRPPLASYSFGGLSAVGAVFFTHPFDLLKIHLQTSKKENLGLATAVRRILRQQGLRGLYQGISGGAMREGTQSPLATTCCWA